MGEQGARNPMKAGISKCIAQRYYNVAQGYRSNDMKRLQTVFRFLPCAAACVLLSLAMPVVRAQGDSASEVTPQVQELYAQAKSAQAQGDNVTAIAKYKAMLRLAPHLAPAYNNLGMLYFNQHDWANAVRVLEQGLKVNPNMPSAQAMLGSALHELGDDRQAIAPLEAALRANPDDSNAEMMLARSQMGVKNYKQAVAHLQRMVAREPKNQEAWYLLGKSYLQLSESALSQVSLINPDSALSHEISGELMESMQNMDGAVVEYKKAIDLEPQGGDAHGHLANAYWLMGKWESAEAEFQKQLTLDPNNCIAQWKMANAMLENNQPPSGALPLLDKAVARCSDLMQARVDRARALVRSGRPADALPDLQIAVKENPEEPSIHFLLAQVYRAEGKADEARAELQTYGRLQRDASAAVAQRASESLKMKQDAH
ncbi:tetratricopeptide repeat protein [Acidipila rosea]|uniref:Tetratricopeptide repeat protein n=2 Tax=Acidipila rosea TaxID=768535 RepID=A0A4R1L6N8_9BACT|nr:tetratricopeptide repeat protein [Acidipila rosea]